MGFDYVVSFWQCSADSLELEYKFYWGGHSYRTALRRLKECRAKGYGCVKLECRNNPADAEKVKE